MDPCKVLGSRHLSLSTLGSRFRDLLRGGKLNYNPFTIMHRCISFLKNDKFCLLMYGYLIVVRALKRRDVLS